MRRKRRVHSLFLFMIIALSGLSGTIISTSSTAAMANTALAGDACETHRSAAPNNTHILTRTIKTGDTLTAIFEDCNISQDVMYQILAADESILALDILRPGHRLSFALNQETNTLLSMTLFLHPGRRILYKRVDDTGFAYEEITIPGDWKQECLEGDIVNNFYLSAREAGLTEQEVAGITGIFRDRIRFASDIRTGDQFQVICSRQFVEREFTGQSRIEGVRIFRGPRMYTAFLFDDGTYYDQRGESLTRALRRYPTAGQYRVTSHFSRSRRHPISHRYAPHNGVDFAMSPGTPVLSVGDGVVSRVRNHPFAGKYIEIQHGTHYITRYLHLRRTLVRRGQTVHRGKRIALSGNTGRSTGPHLHFELHVGGRPVNPLTADIPMASAIHKTQIEKFKQRVGELVALMEQPTKEIACHSTGDDSSLTL